MIYTFSFCHVPRLLSTTEFLNILLWCVRARFFIILKNTSSHVVDSCRNKITCLSIQHIFLTRSKVRFVVRMFSSKFFIKAFRNFPTKLNDDGLYFNRHYKLSKIVIILCLTLNVCLGEEAKSVNGCVGNLMFIESMNNCIGEYTSLNSIYEFIFGMFSKRVQDLKCATLLKYLLYF